MSNWDYAELAKSAKLYGGPEAFENALIQYGRDSMTPNIVGASVGAGCVVGLIAIGVHKALENKKRREDEKLQLTRSQMEANLNNSTYIPSWLKDEELEGERISI